MLILVGVSIHFESAQWASTTLLDPSMTSSTKPVYLLNEDTQKAFVFMSEILSVLGVALTSIAAFRWVKIP